MRPRVELGRFLIRLGNFIRSASLMVLRADDLIEFSRQTYARPKNIAAWVKPDFVDAGLNQEEKALLKKLPLTHGRLLLLGVGGGREAIPLIQMGFDVTGVDFIPEMLVKAKKNAVRHGVEMKGIVQEISCLDVPESSYGAAWMSAAMYSSVPTKQRRIAMLKRIRQALRPGGYFLCQYYWGADNFNSLKAEKAGKVLAWLTLGNISYEPGDMLWHDIEFIHSFSSKEDLQNEFASGGFDIIHLQIPEKKMRGGAVLRKSG
ncbi:MAG: class I SAM-dependent methyltransferase [Candidatus Aminicenantes bacterium]